MFNRVASVLVVSLFPVVSGAAQPAGRANWPSVSVDQPAGTASEAVEFYAPQPVLAAYVREALEANPGVQESLAIVPRRAGARPNRDFASGPDGRLQPGPAVGRDPGGTAGELGHGEPGPSVVRQARSPWQSRQPECRRRARAAPGAPARGHRAGEEGLLQPRICRQRRGHHARGARAAGALRRGLAGPVRLGAGAPARRHQDSGGDHEGRQSSRHAAGAARDARGAAQHADESTSGAAGAGRRAVGSAPRRAARSDAAGGARRRRAPRDQGSRRAHRARRAGGRSGTQGLLARPHGRRRLRERRQAHRRRPA